MILLSNAITYEMIFLYLFSALSIIWYLLFLFIVVIVLLNVLIAQVSDTYAKVLEKAEGYKLFNQCLYIAQLEEQNNNVCMTRGLYRLLTKFECFTKIYNDCHRWCLGKCVQRFSKNTDVSKISLFFNEKYN